MKRILAWADSPVSGTGFGNIAFHILKGLHDSGRYHIDQVGINYQGEFYDRETIPWHVSPSLIGTAGDYLGTDIVLKRLEAENYDYLWVLNDPFNLIEFAASLTELQEKFRRENIPVPKVIFQYPVDGRVRAEWRPFFDVADVVAAVTEHGRCETLKTFPDLAPKLVTIPHGIDTAWFYQLPAEQRKKARADIFKITDDTFLFLNVNTNTVRKQLCTTIIAFSEFKKVVPNSKLYIHAVNVDRKNGLALKNVVQDLGLSPELDVVIPNNLDPSNPISVPWMNRIYNCADAFITTTLGEGWGLTHQEAMAVGIPVICPDNTVFPEQLANGTRGHIFPCRDQICVDNIGLRPAPRIEDIVTEMLEAYKESLAARKSGVPPPRVTEGTQFIRSITWEKVHQQWLMLFRVLDDLSSARAPAFPANQIT